MSKEKKDFSSLLVPAELPSANDQLFRSAGANWQNNACLNFTHNSWLLYATGYKRAADILVASVETDMRDQDTLVYPIVFLYRQYLELAIKDLIREGKKLLDEPEPDWKKSRHELNVFWKQLELIFQQVSPEEATQEIAQIGRLINEFCSLDPTSQSFRYPENKKGEKLLPNVRHIDLINLGNVVDKIEIILDGASAQFDHYLDMKNQESCNAY